MSTHQFDRPMDNPINWSLSVGRLFDVRVRVHLFFLFGAVYVLSQDLKHAEAARQPLSEALAWGMGTSAALFLMVLLHEFGHCFGARRVGGSADEILLWPLGGLASVSPPHDPRSHFITAAAGPFVNLVLFALLGGAIALWLGTPAAIPWNPLHPFTPLRLEAFPTTAQRWLLVVFGLNYTLFLFNVLLPMFPFDGGRLIQALLWARTGYGRSMEIATGMGMVGAIVLAGLSFFLVDQSVLLIGIAAFGYLTCYQQRRQLKEDFAAGDFDYDSARGYAPLEEPGRPRRAGWWARRKAHRLAERARRERDELQRREQEFDRILAKISVSGMASLTSQERRLLEEETQRRRSVNSEE